METDLYFMLTDILNRIKNIEKVLYTTEEDNDEDEGTIREK